MLSREATNTNFIVFGLTRAELEPMTYRTQASILTFTPPTRFLVNSNHPSRKYWYHSPVLEYRRNWEIYTWHAGAAEMLLHINRKFMIGKLK